MSDRVQSGSDPRYGDGVLSTIASNEDAPGPVNILSIDVEEWFHILEVEGTPPLASWGKLESRVERNFEALLELFEQHSVTATCFFLGWIAERYPHLVRRAASAGHEIASHGYAHQLIYTQTPDEFYSDVSRARALLEDMCGEEVSGYRAPGFSITKDTPWAMEMLVRAGYRYDSSLFPASRGHGGLEGAEPAPHFVETAAGTMVEFPISVAEVMGKRVCFFGGGYLRFFPMSLIRRMAQRVNDLGRPVIYYIHPREIDPHHPRLPMGRVRRFKSYVNLSSTRGKLVSILREQRLASFRDWMLKSSLPDASLSKLPVA